LGGVNGRIFPVCLEPSVSAFRAGRGRDISRDAQSYQSRVVISVYQDYPFRFRSSGDAHLSNTGSSSAAI